MVIELVHIFFTFLLWWDALNDARITFSKSLWFKKHVKLKTRFWKWLETFRSFIIAQSVFFLTMLYWIGTAITTLPFIQKSDKKSFWWKLIVIYFSICLQKLKSDDDEVFEYQNYIPLEILKPNTETFSW